MQNVGKVYPSEKSTFRDPETGAEITQYTSVGQTNRTLYFSNRPYTSDREHIIFLSDRTGRNEMFLLHLKSGKITQLTDMPGQANVSNCVHPTKPELYFRTARTIYRVRLDTLQTEELVTTPESLSVGILNMNNPPWLVFDVHEKVEGISRLQGDKLTPIVGGSQMYFLHPKTLLYRYNVDTGDTDCLWGDTHYFDHSQMSPTDPNLIIFSDAAWYGSNRCYYMHVAKRVKTVPKPMFPESMTARGSHECFTRRGNVYIQWMEGDLERDGAHTLYHGFRMVAGLNGDEIPNAPFKKYEVPERQKDLIHHFTMSEDETWGAHDRWLSAPKFDENLAWLSLFRHRDEAPQTVDLKLCFHNGAKGDRLMLGAELTLDDKDEFATYTSFLGGTANVCQVRVTPFVERLMKTSV